MAQVYDFWGECAVSETIAVGRLKIASALHAFIEKVCPDVGEEAVRAALSKQNGSDS